jgi:ABC-type Fe3+ transport system substrate-binding protein
MKKIRSLALNIAFAGLLLASRLAPAAQAPQELEQQAMKEGTLNLGTNGMLTNQVVISAFKNKYPWAKVNLFDFDYINSRYLFFHLFESKDPKERMDVVLRAQDKDIELWIEKNWLADLSSLPGWSERAIGSEPAPRYVYYVGMKHGLVFNPKLTKESDLPKGYDELLSPKWKGKVLMRSPLKGVSAATLTTFIKETRGIEWFRKLGANKVHVTQDYDSQHELVVKGKYPFALSRDLEIVSYLEQQKHKKKRTLSLKFHEMNELPYQYMLGAMNAQAFHPAIAKLFLMFLMSHEAGAILEKKGYSAGPRRLEDFKRNKVWQWNMSSVKSMYEYQSYMAEALRELRDGGADIELVNHFGSMRIE